MRLNVPKRVNVTFRDRDEKTNIKNVKNIKNSNLNEWLEDNQLWNEPSSFFVFFFKFENSRGNALVKIFIFNNTEDIVLVI